MESENPIIQRKLALVDRIGRKDLTVGEVQAILGYATTFPIISDSGLIARHKVVAAKIGGQWSIDADSLKEFIKASTSILPF